MELRGGAPGEHYSADDRFHCPGCGTGLASGEACSIPGCPRRGQRASGRTAATRGATMTGADALRVLGADPAVREGLERGRRIEAEEEQRAKYRPLDDADTALTELRRTMFHPEQW